MHRSDSELEDSDDEREREEEQYRQREEKMKQLQNVIPVVALELDQLTVTIDEDTKESVQYELIMLQILMKAKVGELEANCFC